MFVDVPERVEPVGMIKVSIAAEHLFHDTLAVLVESRREATGLADPIFPGRVRGVGWGSSKGLVDSKGVWCVCHLVGWEHNRVMDLADDPLLNTVDEFRSRDLRSTSVDQPGISQTMKTNQSAFGKNHSICSHRDLSKAYRPADIVGHVASLQIGSPLTAFTSWIT